MSADDRDVITPKQSGTLQRGPGFAADAKDIAKRMSDLVDRFTSVAKTDIRAAILCRRLRDEASMLALEFESWQFQPSTTEQRVAAMRHLADLKERSDRAAALALT
jgi:hypothetical protein